MERQSIGDIIRDNRSKQGLTQKELGEQLNVTDKAVSKWDRNIARPDINTTPKLAQILEVPVAEIEPPPFFAMKDVILAKMREKACANKGVN